MESSPTLNRLASESNGAFLTELHACVEACVKCAQICTSCVDACVADGDVARSHPYVVSAALTCADLCWATARVLSRPTGLDAATAAALLETCAIGCRRCSNCCAEPGGHQHLLVCSAASSECEAACRRLSSRWT